MYREDYAAMTPEERDVQLRQLDVDLRSHPAAAAMGRWSSINRAHRTFAMNARELDAVLDASETDQELQMELIQNVRDDAVRRGFFALLDQRLFNTLASAVTLVEHTNKLRNDYPNTVFWREFERRNKQVADAPGTKFLRKFRNYLVHVGSAPFSSTMSWSGGGADAALRVHLDSAALLERRDFWDAASRQFLEGNPDGIHLRVVSQQYGHSMQELFEWTFSQFESLHGAELESYNSLVARRNLTLSGGEEDGSEWEARMAHVAENIKARNEGRPQTSFIDGAVIDESGEAARRGAELQDPPGAL
ncbi:hypothetical protein AB6N24_14345 [Cellulomonas sp. 179-A 4D5 NHS]|uniref:hypothetical protein n=1 Tax=Cellulomonas sp. 179-A 4D5 NHS TaxID=3142378 RepID=UPI0039A05038